MVRIHRSVDGRHRQVLHYCDVKPSVAPPGGGSTWLSIWPAVHMPKHRLFLCHSVLLHPMLLTRIITPQTVTPWSRVLLERPIVAWQVKKFTAFYGTGRFITVFTRARHLSLSWASCIQSTPFHPISLKIHSNIIFPWTPGVPSGLFPSGFPTKILYGFLNSLVRATFPTYPHLFNHPNNVWWSSPLCSLLQPWDGKWREGMFRVICSRVLFLNLYILIISLSFCSETLHRIRTKRLNRARR
jgi:hypothetical protein